MTTEVREHTYQGTAARRGGSITIHFEKRRSWTPCPRCIGGNMYKDYNGEHVCIQCGFSISPNKITPATV